MRYFLALLLLFPFQTAHAAQPISLSLAECSVIYNVTSISAEAKGKPETQILTMRKMSDVFKEAAVKQASAEGRGDGKKYVDDNLPALIEKWDERWLTENDAKAMSFMKENLEWVNYCKNLGKSRKLLPLKR